MIHRTYMSETMRDPGRHAPKLDLPLVNDGYGKLSWQVPRV